MDVHASFSRRVRTGLFEIDLDSGEVHKEGRKVPVQEQPFRVLAVLLERNGEVVTREELQAWLWPADTYVGFDEGLNTAIECAIDLASPQIHPKAKAAKDLAAGMVLIASIASVVVGLLILGPPLWRRLIT